MCSTLRFFTFLFYGLSIFCNAEETTEQIYYLVNRTDQVGLEFSELVQISETNGGIIGNMGVRGKEISLKLFADGAIDSLQMNFNIPNLKKECKYDVIVNSEELFTVMVRLATNVTVDRVQIEGETESGDLFSYSAIKLTPNGLTILYTSDSTNISSTAGLKNMSSETPIKYKNSTSTTPQQFFNGISDKDARNPVIFKVETVDESCKSQFILSLDEQQMKTSKLYLLGEQIEESYKSAIKIVGPDIDNTKLIGVVAGAVTTTFTAIALASGYLFYRFSRII